MILSGSLLSTCTFVYLCNIDPNYSEYSLLSHFIDPTVNLMPCYNIIWHCLTVIIKPKSMLNCYKLLLNALYHSCSYFFKWVWSSSYSFTWLIWVYSSSYWQYLIRCRLWIIRVHLNLMHLTTLKTLQYLLLLESSPLLVHKIVDWDNFDQDYNTRSYTW